MNLSFKKYRAIDLTIFSVMAVVLEALIVLAANVWFTDVIYTLSLSVTIVSLVMIRWGVWAAIPAVLSALTVLITYNFSGTAVTPDTAVIYIGGNLFMLLGVVFIKLVGREKVEDPKGFLSYVYVLVVYVSLILGKTLIAMCFGKGFMIIANFNFAECISLIIAVVAVFIAKRQEGMFIDQKAYLLALEKERQDEAKKANDPL